MKLDLPRKLLAAAILALPAAPASPHDTGQAGRTAARRAPRRAARGRRARAAADSLSGLLSWLRSAGARAHATGDEVDQPFFSVTGKMISVDGADVQVFEYASAAAAAREAAPVSPDGSSVGGSKPMWVGTPHFFRSGRMIVLYVGDDAKLLGALAHALGKQFAGR